MGVPPWLWKSPYYETSEHHEQMGSSPPKPYDDMASGETKINLGMSHSCLLTCLRMTASCLHRWLKKKKPAVTSKLGGRFCSGKHPRISMGKDIRKLLDRRVWWYILWVNYPYICVRQKSGHAENACARIISHSLEDKSRWVKLPTNLPYDWGKTALHGTSYNFSCSLSENLTVRYWKWPIVLVDLVKMVIVQCANSFCEHQSAKTGHVTVQKINSYQFFGMITT